MIDPLIPLVNSVREQNGCKIPLKQNANLTMAAKHRIEYVFNGHWSHDGNWKEISSHYKGRYLGENLARNFDNDENVIFAWLISKTHREVMLDCKYTDTGVARKGSYYIQLFGKD